MKKFAFLVVILSLLKITGLSQEMPEFNEVYKKTLQNWQKSHARWKLRNFVPLIGIDYLKEGDNTFGKDPSNDIVVNSIKAPDFMGKIVKEGREIRYVNTSGIEAKLAGKRLEDLTYTFDGDRNSERIRSKFLKWYIQFVEEDFFLRLIDETSPLVSSFEPYDFFPANEEFIVMGKYKPYKEDKIISLDNVIALKQRYKHTGKVTFKYLGKKYELEVLEGALVMFSDDTNGDKTFPHGRYLRVRANKDGSMLLDFNYCFSPPRSVSLYTTCEIPPESNHLPFAITAGEMYENTGEPIIRNIRN